MARCYVRDLCSLMSDPEIDVCEHNLTRGERAGLYSVIFAAGTSLIATTTVFLLIAHRAAQNLRITSTSPMNRPRRIFSTHLDIYVFFLLFSDLMQAIGTMLTIHWLRQGRTTCGTGHRKLSQTRVIVSRQEPDHPLFAPTPFWCWISAHYDRDRIPAFYVWLWSCTGLSILLYVPLFLYIRGNLEIDPCRIWPVSLRRAPPPVEKYPVVYVVLSVPFSVMRWTGSFEAKHTVDDPWYFFCVSLHYYEGLANALILTLTRPSILGFAKREHRRGSLVNDASEPQFVHPDQEMESVHNESTGEEEGGRRSTLSETLNTQST
ncbi:hypothetical protein EXIGLDRAFT_765907 [Exidia glandulosa HHB12029]|uniref:Glucose receptor Git3 N-terminal domain-containing protein n=1 Tax=Exidia glandulosa HHB12029 TaxID=1314781 RepID=A0A165K5M8_EXIGL|nr:hypothetical protein EXIGLDRAFT_765907 [Exidia glandulosa HHB12029]